MSSASIPARADEVAGTGDAINRLSSPERSSATVIPGMLKSGPASAARSTRIDLAGPCVLAIDAGVEHLRLHEADAGADAATDTLLPNHGDLSQLFARLGLTARLRGHSAPRVVITGKLASTVRAALGTGRTVEPSEALWMAGRRAMAASGAEIQTLAMVDLSASGYLLVGLDRRGDLARDLLVVNPRCGAGSGINLDRVLQKLDVTRERVDDVLAVYAGDTGTGAARGHRGAGRSLRRLRLVRDGVRQEPGHPARCRARDDAEIRGPEGVPQAHAGVRQGVLLGPHLPVALRPGLRRGLRAQRRRARGHVRSGQRRRDRRARGGRTGWTRRAAAG